jgi:hypothetical protein
LLISDVLRLELEMRADAMTINQSGLIELPVFVGIDAAYYTVEDLDFAAALFKDWGLDPVERNERAATLKTHQGSRVILTNGGEGAPGGYGELTKSPGFRGVMWGVRGERDLNLVQERLSSFCKTHRDSEGSVWAVDPFGYDIGFRVWRFAPIPPSTTLINSPGLKLRISDPAPAYTAARPVRIGHAVFEIAGETDFRRVYDFYVNRLGFSSSDRYEERGAFLRCAVEQDHHNLALLNVNKNTNRFQHLAFEMHDIHEVFSGGLHFSELGNETAIGPGRHKFSSAYFWYFENPLGGELEYFADMDYLDASWEPRNQEPDPSSIAEWALPRGARRFKSMRELKETN